MKSSNCQSSSGSTLVRNPRASRTLHPEARIPRKSSSLKAPTVADADPLNIKGTPALYEIRFSSVTTTQTPQATLHKPAWPKIKAMAPTWAMAVAKAGVVDHDLPE